MDIKDKIEYIVVVMGEFARRHGLDYKDAFNYIRKYRGMDLLDNGYKVEHLFSIEDAVDDVTRYCKRYGGQIG